MVKISPDQMDSVARRAFAEKVERRLHGIRGSPPRFLDDLEISSLLDDLEISSFLDDLEIS